MSESEQNSTKAISLDELKAYEQRLRSREEALNTREQQLAQRLNAEMERLITDFDHTHQEKIVGLQKRFMVHEKAMKAKIKLLEAKLKDNTQLNSNNSDSIKSLETSTSTQNSDNKLLLKVVSLERSNEFLKLKNMDLERKILSQQASSSTLVSKPKAASKDTREQESVRSESESGSPNIIASKMGKDKAGKSEEKAPVKVLKKKVGTSTTTTKSLTSYSDELKILLQTLDKIVFCLRFSPFVGELQLQNVQEHASHNVENLLFPVADSLLASSTELLHLVNRPLVARSLSGLVELFFKLLRLQWQRRTKNKDPIVGIQPDKSESEINALINKVRTSKDHVDEIMSGSRYVSSLVDKEFAPVTEYWKKITKSSVKDKKQELVVQREVNTKDDPPVRLFPSTDIQKEVVRILVLFISTSDVMLVTNCQHQQQQPLPEDTEKGEEKQDLVTEVKKELPLDSIKSLLVMRLVSALIVLLLSKSSKDLVAVLECIRGDLFGKNNKISGFLKHYFVVECSGTEILTFTLEQQPEKVIVQLVAEVSALLRG